MPRVSWLLLYGLHAARCVLHAARCVLHAARCVLHAARSMLHAARCTLRVAGDGAGGEGPREVPRLGLPVAECDTEVPPPGY
jgi:hypothetical protein